MSKKDEALKLALSTLANARDWIGNDPEGRWNEDEMYDELCNMVKFVSEALAEQPAPPPECQTEAEKTAFAFGWFKALEQKRKADSALDRMAENARELGLDYEPIVEQVEDSVGMGHGAWDMVEPKKLAKAFHEALAEQPAQQQEPVAHCRVRPLRGDQSFPTVEVDWVSRPVPGPLYTTPPQPSKPWVGLTDEEEQELYQEWNGWRKLIRLVEAKLKERNT